MDQLINIRLYQQLKVIKKKKKKEGFHFFDAYSLVIKITPIRVLIAIAALHNLEIYHMNVKIAFLNGELEEKIYMEQPKCFVPHGQEKSVYKFVKLLYGLKQTPKQRHKKFDKTMLLNGFRIKNATKLSTSKAHQMNMLLYVYDMLIMNNNSSIIMITRKH